MGVCSDIVSYVITNDAVLRETQIENCCVILLRMQGNDNFEERFLWHVLYFLVTLEILRTRAQRFFYV
jgi:hypothetical protein